MPFVEEFINKLKSRTRAWSEVGCSSEIGIRIIKMSGELVRAAMLDEALISEWIEQLLAQLPPDTCLLDSATPVFLDYSMAANAYVDRYCIVVTSKEWERVGDGTIIPEFTPLFLQAWECDRHVPPFRNRGGMKYCEVCGVNKDSL